MYKKRVNEQTILFLLHTFKFTYLGGGLLDV